MKTLSVINDEKKLAIELQKLAPELTSNEIQIYISSTKHQKLSEIEDVNTFVRFQTSIDSWAKLLGLAKPDPQELQEMTETISNLYPNFTIQDLELSVASYLKNELEIEEKPYGRLSIYFITRVLNGYKSYRAKSIVNARQAMAKHEQSTKKEIDEQQRVQTFKEFLTLAKAFSDSGETYLDLGHRLFEYITNNKIIIITQEDWDKKLEEATEHVKVETKKEYLATYMGKLLSGLSETKKAPESEIDPKKISITAKRLIVNNWLNSINLQQELDKVTIEKILK